MKMTSSSNTRQSKYSNCTVNPSQTQIFYKADQTRMTDPVSTLNPRMEPTTTKLRFYDGTTISVVGEATLKCQANEKEQDITFMIGQQKPPLSEDTFIRLGLLTINSVQTIAVATDNGQPIGGILRCLSGARLSARRISH